MSSALRFRRATVADAPALALLVESAYRGDASRAGWTTEADLLGGQRTSDAEIRGIIESATGRMVIAEDEAGAMVATMRLEDDARGVYIGMLSVAPKRQGAGLGKALLAEAERVATEELGRTRTRMTVIAQRPELLEFYARRGYQPTGETEPFPYGDERFGLPKRDDLYFVVLARELPPSGSR